MLRHGKTLAIVLWLAAASIACNLGAAPPTPIPATNTPGSASKPRVIVQSPSSGAQFPVNQTVPVSVIATDEQGVTRVQLFVNGTLAKTVSSQNINGDTNLSAVLDFVPRNTGELALRVIAYRGTTASDPADLSVNIGNAATNTPQVQQPTQPGIPPIPNDGVCRTLVNQAANLRSTPTTTAGNNVLIVMPQFSLTPVTARLADNSWWKVNYNGRIGWVSASLTTIYGNCGSIPIESPLAPTPTTPPVVVTVVVTAPPTVTPTPPPLADLVVTNITGPSSIALGGAASVTQNYSVVVTNIGLGTARNFSASLRVNSGTAIDLGTISELAQGQSITLVRPITFTGAGNYTLQAEADPANVVQEVSNVNNIGIVNVSVTP